MRLLSFRYLIRLVNEMTGDSTSDILRDTVEFY